MKSIHCFIFKLAIITWISVQYVRGECPRSKLLKRKDYQKFNIMVSIKSDQDAVMDMLYNNTSYTGPKGKDINITFICKDKKAPYFKEICMQIRCVKQITVKYHGPWKDVSFLDASGNPVWIEETPDEFPEEKFPLRGSCKPQEMCLIEPGSLTQFSLLFVFSSCSNCFAVTIDYVKITQCTEDKGVMRVTPEGIVHDTQGRIETSVVPVTISQTLVNKPVNFSQFIITSTDVNNSFIPVMFKDSNSTYVAPSEQEKLNTTFEVPDKGSVAIRQLCMETKCVSRILVDYYGPWEKEAFRDVTGKLAWIYISTWFPEEKNIIGPCQFTLTCFTLPAEPSAFKPDHLSKFSLIFMKHSRCTNCDGILIKELQGLE